MEHFKKLTSLEVLLLSFVKYGLSTSYDLISEAGMSIGQTGKAFQRLKESGLLTGEPGPRRSERFTITKKGENELLQALNPERESRSDWLAQFGVFESAPRAMFLAWLYSDHTGGLNHMNWSRKELEHRIHDKHEEADRCLREIRRLRTAAPKGDLVDMGPLIAQVHWWMKAVSDAALLQGQIDALEKVGPILSKMPSITQSGDEFLKAVQNLEYQKDLMDFSVEGDNPPNLKIRGNVNHYFGEPMSDAARARLEDLELQGSGSPEPEPSTTPRPRKAHGQ